MASWALLIQVLSTLQPAFPRGVSFLWFQVIIVGLITRPDDEGVTSIVRGVGLGERAYGSIVKHFERTSCDFSLMTRLWTRAVLKYLDEQLYRVNDRLVIVVDSTKGKKSGERMPGVKRLRSSKTGAGEAEYIRGHHVHVAAVLACFGEFHVAIPLVARLCEGIKLSPNDLTPVRGKMVDIQDEMGELPLSYVVADRFFAAGTYISPMLERGHHVVCRVKSNAVCVDRIDSPLPAKARCPGRPRMYANSEKVTDRAGRLPQHKLPCPWNKATMKVCSFVAYWKPLGREVLWVVARHPSHSTPFIALSTDTALSTHDVLHKLYAPRWSIETGFMFLKKQLGFFMYRFWTSALNRPKKAKGDLYLHRMEEETRDAILAKIKSYNYFIQCGVVAQGLLQIVSIRLDAASIHNQVDFFLRTVREGSRPSEMLVRRVLTASFASFLQATPICPPLTKFIERAQENEITPNLKMAA
jgi:hypothetical protein